MKTLIAYVIGAVIILILFNYIRGFFDFDFGFGSGSGSGSSPSKKPQVTTIKESEKNNTISIRIEESSIFIDNNQVSIDKIVTYIKSKQLVNKHSVNVNTTNGKIVTEDQLKDLLNKEGIAFTSKNP